jgi:hypothetical protein
MRNSKFLLAVLGVALSGLAQAGKAERDFYAAEVDPAVKAAAATLKKSCGCDVKFDVNMSTLQTVDHMRQVRGFANSITEKAGGYCTDAPSKAAICQMKSVSVSRTNEANFKFSGGKATATTDESSFPHWDMMTPVLDK